VEKMPAMVTLVVHCLVDTEGDWCRLASYLSVLDALDQTDREFILE
jgi:hypothetical protein